jgi:hypothetical protein
MPRVVLLALALFSNWFTIAYETVMWPILGWFFMPFTTLAYMSAMVYNDRTISGGYIVLVVVAVCMDIVVPRRYSSTEN